MKYSVTFKQNDQGSFKLIEFQDYSNGEGNTSTDWMCYSDFVTIIRINEDEEKEKFPIYKISTVSEVYKNYHEVEDIKDELKKRR